MSNNSSSSPITNPSSSEPVEQKLMEGVYFTDYRKKSSSSENNSAPTIDKNSPIQIRASIQELKHRLGHLNYSNDELRKVIKELKGDDNSGKSLSEDDKDSLKLYEESVLENIMIIERDEKRKKELEEKLRYEEMKGSQTKEMLL